jgi:TnsA endonuclease-like protein
MNSNSAWQSPAQIRTNHLHTNLTHLWEILIRAGIVLPQFRIPSEHSQSADVRIVWADEGDLARQVISRSSARQTTKFPSSKMKGMIPCESGAEVKATKIVEVHPMVKEFRAQPARIHYVDFEGNERIHYPDLSVLLQNGSVLLIEIKPDRDFSDESLVSRTLRLTSALEAEGIIYMVIFEYQLGGTVQANADLILRRSKTGVDPQTCDFVRRLFKTGSSQSLAHVCLALSQVASNMAMVIFHLIRSGTIWLDMTIPIDQNSRLYWMEGK